MRNLRLWLVSLFVFGAAMAAHADNPLDCSKKSLAEAVSDVSV